MRPVSWLKHGIGALLLLPTVAIWALWINALNEGATQQTRVQIFLSRFPSGTTLGMLTIVAVASSLAAIAAGAFALQKATTEQRILDVVAIVLGVLFTFLDLFQLL